jgi:hypothetical protein
LLIFNDYGQLDGDVSATHHEYRLAQDLKLPTLVFLKGADDARKERRGTSSMRSSGTSTLTNALLIAKT